MPTFTLLYSVQCSETLESVAKMGLPQWAISMLKHTLSPNDVRTIVFPTPLISIRIQFGRFLVACAE